MFLLLLPAVLFLAMFYVVPLLRMIGASLFTPGFTLDSYAAIAASPVYGQVLLNTIGLGVKVTLGCLVLGYPVAFLLARLAPRARNVVMIGIVLPYFTSVLVRSYAWLILLGRQGMVNELLRSLGIIDHPLKIIYDTPGVLIAMVHILLPVMIFALYSGMQGIDWTLGRVAASLGCTRLQTLLRIYLPLSLPAVVAGALLVYISATGFYVTPALVGGPRDTTLPMLISTEMNELLDWPMGSALSVLLLVVTLVLFVVLDRLCPIETLWGRGGGSARPPARTVFAHLSARLLPPVERAMLWSGDVLGRITDRCRGGLRIRGRGRPAALHRPGLKLLGFCGGVLLFLLLPILLIVPVSFTSSLYLQFPPHGFSLRWYRDIWDTPYWLQATWLSLRVALATTLAALVLGTLAAIAFARGRFPGRRILYLAVLTPLIVPVIVLAVALYSLFSVLHLIGTPTALILGHLVGALPLVIVLMTGALEGIDRTLETAAIGLGASRVQAFRRVTFPMIRPSLMVAGFFAFMYSFDEVVMASFLGSISAETLPKKMWEGVRLEIRPTLAAISCVLVLFTALLLGCAELAQRRRNGHASSSGPPPPAAASRRWGRP